MIVISSCSSLDNLRFWKSDEVDIDEPKKLMSFSDEKALSINWKNAYKCENNMGSFIPDFSSPSIPDRKYVIFVFAIYSFFPGHMLVTSSNPAQRLSPGRISTC